MLFLTPDNDFAGHEQVGNIAVCNDVIFFIAS